MKSQKINASVAINLDPNLLKAIIPLLERGEIQGLEWSFDAIYNHSQVPDWFSNLLLEFGKQNRLIGHGIYFSLFSGKWTLQQQHWLDELKEYSNKYAFDHISEHFGFMTGEHFHKGAPLAVPFTHETLQLGQDRLKRIYNSCERPVGLENLAFAYSLDQVKVQGEFLHRLVEPVNGFIILDLHNLYCQIQNFNCAFEDLIQLYPLDRVREIHISGGSWRASSVNAEKHIRRDTHDGKVPKAVFELLEKCVPLCPNLKFVVLEQMGHALQREEDKEQFRADFRWMNKIIASRETDMERKFKDFHPVQKFDLDEVVESELLTQQQRALSTILENAQDVSSVVEQLSLSVLANSAWQTENWEPSMIETAYLIARKWKDGAQVNLDR